MPKILGSEVIGVLMDQQNGIFIVKVGNRHAQMSTTFFPN